MRAPGLETSGRGQSAFFGLSGAGVRLPGPVPGRSCRARVTSHCTSDESQFRDVGWGLILGLTSLGLPLPEGRSSPVVVPRQDKTTAGHSGESTEQIVRMPRDRRGPLSLWCRGGWRPPEPWLHEERMGWQGGAVVMVAVGIPSGADGGCAQHGGHVRGRSAEGRGGTWGSARCLLIHLTRHLSSKRRNRARGFLSQAPSLDYIGQDAEGEN